MKITDFQKSKLQQRKITMVTCYDYWTAKIIDQSNIDAILVGDSAAMIVHGHATPIPMTTDMIAVHVAAVARGITRKLIVGDMPFLSYRQGLKKAMQNVAKIMQAGAHAIKLEGVVGHEKLVRHIVDSGVPVMGHIGLTPQSFHQLGGFQVQGKDHIAARRLLQEALQLEEAGCFAIVLECVPPQTAEQITQKLTIPTIGIGAGLPVDGQILVLQDLLGMNNEFKPKFLKTYLDGFQLIQNALNQYDQEVKDLQFPTAAHCYQFKAET